MGNYPQYNYGSQLQNMGTFPQLQQMFPQPQGSVYSINAPLDVGNVPIGSTGLSVALCLTENLMYIKSFQNGNPVIMAYRIAPFTKDTTEKGGQTQTAAAQLKDECPETAKYFCESAKARLDTDFPTTYAHFKKLCEEKDATHCGLSEMVEEHMMDWYEGMLNRIKRW